MPIVMNFNPAFGMSISRHGDAMAQAMIRKAELDAAQKQRSYERIGDSILSGFNTTMQRRFQAGESQKERDFRMEMLDRGQEFDSEQAGLDRDLRRELTYAGFGNDAAMQENRFDYGREMFGAESDFTRERDNFALDRWFDQQDYSAGIRTEAGMEDALNEDWISGMRESRLQQAKMLAEQNAAAQQFGFTGMSGKSPYQEALEWSQTFGVPPNQIGAVKPIYERVGNDLQTRTPSDIQAGAIRLMDASRRTGVPHDQLQYGVSPEGQQAIGAIRAQQALAMRDPAAADPRMRTMLQAAFLQKEREAERAHADWVPPPSPQKMFESQGFVEPSTGALIAPKGWDVLVSPDKTPEALEFKKQQTAAKEAERTAKEVERDESRLADEAERSLKSRFDADRNNFRKTFTATPEQVAAEMNRIEQRNNKVRELRGSGAAPSADGKKYKIGKLGGRMVRVFDKESGATVEIDENALKGVPTEAYDLLGPVEE